MKEIYVVKLGYNFKTNEAVEMAFEDKADAEFMAEKLGDGFKAVKLVEGDPYATYSTKAMMKGAADGE